jgi:hypothetical protein
MKGLLDTIVTQYDDFGPVEGIAGLSVIRV